MKEDEALHRLAQAIDLMKDEQAKGGVSKHIAVAITQAETAHLWRTADLAFKEKERANRE